MDTFEFLESDGNLILRGPANLDSAAAARFPATADIVARLGERRHLTLELAATDFMDSAGIGFIVTVTKGLRGVGRDLRIVGATGQPAGLIALVGLDKLVRVEPAAPGSS